MVADVIKTRIGLSLLIAFLLYSLFLYSFLPVTKPLQSDQSDVGKHLWQQHNCQACHQVYGLGGFLGPDLTNVYSIRGAEYIKAFISGGNKTMPAFHLEEKDMMALLSYLQELDASGSADPRTFRISNDGSIEQSK